MIPLHENDYISHTIGAHTIVFKPAINEIETAIMLLSQKGINMGEDVLKDKEKFNSSREELRSFLEKVIHKYKNNQYKKEFSEGEGIEFIPFVVMFNFTMWYVEQYSLSCEDLKN